MGQRAPLLGVSATLTTPFIHAGHVVTLSVPPRQVLLPLPGHTPGMSGAMVNLDRSGSFLLASDAVSVRDNLDREIIPKTTWDANVLVGSLAEIRHVEASGATVICGHDSEQWSTLKKGIQFYD